MNKHTWITRLAAIFQLDSTIHILSSKYYYLKHVGKNIIKWINNIVHVPHVSVIQFIHKIYWLIDIM